MKLVFICYFFRSQLNNLYFSNAFTFNINFWYCLGEAAKNDMLSEFVTFWQEVEICLFGLYSMCTTIAAKKLLEAEHQHTA